ncbi:chemotaxis protein [Rheinheimera sp.]|uniref:chemotaxis protein n=1 Tax=Rheinheimera sp. TaxID=1869214 RepID=UPI0040481D1D
MPLPLILGAAALATAAYGAKKGYDGYQKHSEADEIVKSAKHRYDRNKTEFDEQEQETTHSLDSLGNKELDIGKNLNEFTVLADQLLQKLNTGKQDKLVINIPKHQLKKIESYSYAAIGVLSSIAGAAGTGAAAGFAVYGGVMALGAASTGTAISSLAGAAATKATLAAIGGGSLATGGLGIAGGTAILSAAVAAPVLAVAGWAYDKHGEASLDNANKASLEADEAIRKLGLAIVQLREAESYARKIRSSLSKTFNLFLQYFDSLKDIESFLRDVQGRNVDIDKEIGKFGEDILRLIENGYALASILVNVITTPIFKLKTIDGQLVKNADGVPEIELDSDGIMIVNNVALDEAMELAKSEAADIPAA